MGFIGKFLDFVGVQRVNNIEIEKGIEQKQQGTSDPAYDFILNEAYKLINADYTDRCDLEKLEKISRDETVSNALDFLAFNILQKINLNGYTHENKAIEECVKKSIEHHEGSFQNSVKDILKKGLFYGYNSCQTIFDIVDNNYLWGWTVNYNSVDISYQIAKNDRNKEFIGKIKIGTKEYLAQNFIHYIHGDLSNMYGYGRGNYLEKYYDLKVMCLKMWAVFIQKFTMPTLLGKTKGKIKDLMDKLKKWTWLNIICLNTSEDIDEQVDVVERKAGLGGSNEYITAISFINMLIYRVFFLPPLLEAGQAGGSYALGDVHFKMFDKACSEIAREFKDQVLLAQWVQTLIINNFGEQDSYGDFVEEDTFTLEEKKMMMEILEKLTNTGYLDSIEDNEFVRKIFKIPPMKNPAEALMKKMKEEIANARTFEPDTTQNPEQNLTEVQSQVQSKN